MLNSFNIALTGLNANSAAIDTTGDNLANLNTAGFKSNTVNFLDLVNSSAVSAEQENGIGIGQTLDLRNFTQGAIQTASPLSAAIQGDGFFVLNNNGVSEYTRAGNFSVDQNGNLTTPTGELVQGWMAGSDGVVNSNGAYGNITIPASHPLPPVATTQFSADFNLDSEAVAGSASGAFSTAIQVYDSLGNAHTLTLTLTKPTPSGGGSATAGSWNYSITAPAADQTSGGGTPLATGTLTFDANGNLTDPPASGGPIAVNMTGLSDGAADLAMQWSLYNADGTPRITQYAAPSATSATSQDGSAAAEVTGISIADGGQVMATYSNGTQKVAAQLALAGISNPDSLVSVGNNNFTTTAETATPVVGAPESGGRGQIVGGSIEASNVDIGTEFTNLMVYERAYQADSKVILTSDDMMQSVVNLIQQ